jgi:fatty acid desaturase
LLRERLEGKTLALICLCYGLWGFLIFGSAWLPAWLSIILLIPLIAFHSSLQHECIHGHPFTAPLLNDLISSVPLGIFLPYPRYKENHLIHHQKASISDPVEDPESWYMTQEKWTSAPTWIKAILNANNTLIGRLFLGPALGMGSLILSDLKKTRAGRRELLAIWGGHAILCFILLFAISSKGSISVAAYLACAYFGMSILMIRTFLEHQAHKDMRGRSVLIEDNGPLRFLFLNNNLHAVHHAYPSLAWYRLPVIFKLHRDRFLQMNKGYHYRSYGDVFRKFTFSRKEPVVFPLDRS